MISGVLHVLKTGCRWRDVPTQYGPATTIYNRYHRWSGRGIWQRMFNGISASGDIPAELNLDSSHVKVHGSAAGAKGGVDAGDWPITWRPHNEIHCLPMIAADRSRSR